MKINKNFKDKYQRLVEYKVNDLNRTTPLYANDIETGFIKEEDPTPDENETKTDDGFEQPQGTIPNAETEPEELKEPENNDLEVIETKTGILKDLAQNHTEKIDAILHYMENMSNEIMAIKQKESEIDAIKGELQTMTQQIDFLTPPTPEESLDKMIRISGGININDYWKDYLAKQGKTMNGNLPYYANGNLSNEKAEIVNTKYSDDELKQSLGLK